MRLQLKILLAILPTVLLSIAGLGFWADHQATQNTMDTVDKYLHGVLHAYVSQTLEPQQALLKQHGLESIPSFVASYQADVAPHIEGIELPWPGHLFILDARGRTIHCSVGQEAYHNGQPWEQIVETMRAQDIQQYNAKKEINSRQVYYRIERYRPWEWFIIAYVDMEEITKAATSIRRGSLLAATTSAILIILVMTYLSRRFLVAPIASLSQAARAIASQGKVPAIPEYGNDELGQLARDLGETLQIIEDGRLRLQEWNRELEEQVTARTKDLEEANELLRHEVRQRKETETKLRLAQHMASLGYWVVNHAAGTLTWSEEVYDIFDVRKESFTPSVESFLEMVHPEDRKEVETAYALALERGQQYDISHRIVRSDGAVRHVHQHGANIFDDSGVPLHFQGSIQDITESKRNQHALTEALNKYRDVVEGTDNLVTQVDTNGVFTYLNQTAHSVYGLEPSEMVGKTAFTFIHPEDRDATEQAFMGWVRSKVRHATFDNRQVSVSGEVRRLTWSINFEYDEDNRLVAINAIARDVTRERAAQQKLKDFTLKLARSNKEIKSFAYIVSHDLRAPLVNLKGFAAELAYSIKDLMRVIPPLLPQLDHRDRVVAEQALNEDIPEALTFIQQSAQRMDSLINQILALSRLGRRELKLEEVNVDEVVSSVLKDLSHQIETHGISVEIGPMPVICADRSAMDQILSNLLSNAIKYRSKERNCHIKVTSHRGEQESVFTISDNGTGIVPGDMDKVFEPFRRAASKDIPGEGMGLAFVQTLLRKLGGRIWCESEHGTGSTFYFTIADNIEEEDDQK